MNIQSNAGEAPTPPKEIALDLGGGVLLELVLIPAGKFTMGSPADEKSRNKDEGPQHEVTITKPFYLGKFVVTQAQYEKVMGANPSEHKGADQPVETASWDDAQEFCKKLSAQSKKTVNLPTEAKWEYACRAGTLTRFNSGDKDEDLDGVAWYGFERSEKTTHPVGKKLPNAWGLYDTHGNIWEWCHDWFEREYAAGPASDPQSSVTRGGRVVRGGAWHYAPRHCRSAHRYGYAPDIRGGALGFRVCVPPPRTP